MSGPGRYPVPAGEHRAELVVQRSRFIATVAPAPTTEAASEFVKRISAEFADATHNCWAFVAGPPGSTGHIGMSDDGEPHGTAGRPMLTVLLHGGVGDIAAVVTRYYGGTKLGTGGLARAYGGALQLAMQDLPLGERVELVALAVTVDYGAVDALRQLLPAHEARLVDERYVEAVTYELRLPAATEDAFRQAVLDATRGRARIERPDAED